MIRMILFSVFFSSSLFSQIITKQINIDEIITGSAKVSTANRSEYYHFNPLKEAVPLVVAFLINKSTEENNFKYKASRLASMFNCAARGNSQYGSKMPGSCVEELLPDIANQAQYNYPSSIQVLDMFRSIEQQCTTYKKDSIKKAKYHSDCIFEKLAGFSIVGMIDEGYKNAAFEASNLIKCIRYGNGIQTPYFNKQCISDIQNAISEDIEGRQSTDVPNDALTKFEKLYL